MFIEWPLKGPFNTNVHLQKVSVATQDSHVRVQKVLSERVQLRQRFFFFFFFFFFLLFSV